jgi:hypothetical protein
MLLCLFCFTFFKPLKEYLLYIEAVKEALTRRDSVQIEYELTVEELKKKRAEKDLVSFCRIIFSCFSLHGISNEAHSDYTYSLIISKVFLDSSSFWFML